MVVLKLFKSLFFYYIFITFFENGRFQSVTTPGPNVTSWLNGIMGSGTPISSFTTPVTPRLPFFFGTTSINPNVSVTVPTSATNQASTSPNTATLSTSTSPNLATLLTSTSPNPATTSTTASTTTSTTPAPPEPEGKIIYTMALWRHGERYPVDFFPGDIYTADSFPPGELIPVGFLL